MVLLVVEAGVHPVGLLGRQPERGRGLTASSGGQCRPSRRAGVGRGQRLTYRNRCANSNPQNAPDSRFPAQMPGRPGQRASPVHGPADHRDVVERRCGPGRSGQSADGALGRDLGARTPGHAVRSGSSSGGAEGHGTGRGSSCPRACPSLLQPHSNPSNRPFGDGAEREPGENRALSGKPTAHAQGPRGQRSLGCVGGPTGPDRGRGFRAPTADPVDRGAFAAPGEPGVTGPGPDEARPAVVRGTGWRWVLAAGGMLVIAMAVIAALAFRLGSSSADSATQPSQTPTPAATATPFRSPTCTNRSCRPW